ncbi:ABC transporter permease [uncultured Mucilaginibacter sp.]|uniref:ABC transporter permease n=1 Tax=uncultured Mucilaginibacter sp. TaxID=797541 RepID=UPI00260F524B|nr:ABC transporter permease [uncultured Mucilaginibacter sp.]
MIKNYFKSAWRTLLKNKVTTLINLFGLSVGMTTAVFIFIWVHNETSFDEYQPNSDHVFRITNTIQINKNETWKFEASPMLLREAADREIPEVAKSVCLITNSSDNVTFTIKHQLFTEKTSAYVDKNWFNFFHYDFVAGNANSFSRDPFSIVLTQGKAKKYFGDIDPIGKIIKVDSVNYTVQGIVKNNPVNSSFQSDIMMQIGGRLADPQTLKNDKSWGNFHYITFLQLKPAANLSQVENKLNDIINKNSKVHTDKISLERLKDMYFETDHQFSTLPHGNKKTTYIFSILGFLLLVIACINYINLTTAKASLRAKEISIRKIVGAGRLNLFFQFITESLVISALALFITILLVKLFLPIFNIITEQNFELPITSTILWQVLLETLLFATILNGIYPAALLSSFKPLNVFRGKSVLKLNDGSIRKGLVVFQFSLSTVLIIGTIIIYKQLQFIQTINPGYNVSQIMSVQVPFKTFFLKKETREALYENLKHNLQLQSSIAAVSSGGSEIIDVTGSGSGNADWNGRDTSYNPAIARLNVGDGFQKMFRLKLKAGNWFELGNTNHNYILNETAAASFKLHQPIIGQRFSWGGDTGQVVAVVKDFHYKNLHEVIGPMVITNDEDDNPYFFIKVNPGNISKAITAVKAIWNKSFPDEPFKFTFLDDSFSRLYKSDIKTSRLILIFSVIAIIISALGLFGLAAFNAEQRTKEIGIRKVLGASVQQITALLSKDFLLLVLISIVIASPVAWWAMQKWLQNFAYRITMSWWIFALAAIIALVIALATISFQAIKAALANPVKSLRSE